MGRSLISTLQGEESDIYLLGGGVDIYLLEKESDNDLLGESSSWGGAYLVVGHLQVGGGAHLVGRGR